MPTKKVWRPVERWVETPYYRRNDDRTVYTWLGRMVSLLVGCGLLILGGITHLLLGSTGVGKGLESIIGFGVLMCLWIVVIGRASSD
jgi:hypothetical protein